MEPRIKRAVLLTALVCPGTGQWMLGQRAKGGVVIAVTVSLVVLFGFRLVRMMLAFYDELMDAIYSGENVVGFERINEMHLSIYADNWWLLLVIALLWGWAIWDIYPRASR
jgi:mannose/fructose/N-acetylgalactosamine-specific phosphotransferase system component IIC